MISKNDIRPFVRYAQTIVINNEKRFENVIAYDHRLFYVKAGEGRIVIGETEYKARRSDLFIFSSGIKYSLISGQGENMELIGLSFDLEFGACEIKAPLPPSKEGDFDPSLLIEKPTSPSEPLFLPIVQHKRADLEIELLGIFSEYKSKLRLYEHKLSGRVLALFIDALQREEKGVSVRMGERIDRVLEIIKEHYSEPLTNNMVGKMTGYHENHINRLMVRHTGSSLHSYLQSYRIERAIDLLESTALPINEICALVGFSDFTHFSKTFKKKTGYTPSGFRKGKIC